MTKQESLIKCTLLKTLLLDSLGTASSTQSHKAASQPHWKNPTIRLGHNSTWNWKVSCSSHLYHYHIKCFVIRNNQVVTKKITSLPSEVGGWHSSFSATWCKWRNSNGQQLQFFTVRPCTSVKLNCLHFHVDIFLTITPPNSADISTQLCVTSLQKEKEATHVQAA